MSSGHKGGDEVSSRSAIAETARDSECRTIALGISVEGRGGAWRRLTLAPLLNDVEGPPSSAS